MILGAGQVGQDVTGTESLASHLSRPLMNRNGKRARRRGNIVARSSALNPRRPAPTLVSCQIENCWNLVSYLTMAFFVLTSGY